ncbi:hypothetical protein Q5P01_008644 [Channa striata]|uniref:Interleukin n=1 Tax=Channa striata TaxID=64152 RepID=A0AA88SZJ1_CHASR|nr:hypothetical protein Q5P01_008644 [Channa striata]
MRTDVKCLNDSTFYAPDNIKDECITAALECVLREFNVTVRDECTDPKQYIDQEIDYLDQIIQHRPEAGHDVKSSKCQCERWSQTPFDEFLNKVQSLIELSNTASKS